MLREPRAADAERLFAYTSDPEVTRFLAFDPPRSVAESLRFIARAEVLRTCDAEYVFTIADSLTGEPLGITGLRHLDLMMGTAQIGTWLRRASWGTGVNPEANGCCSRMHSGRSGCTSSRRASRWRTDVHAMRS